jgi:hypothetical protein
MNPEQLLREFWRTWEQEGVERLYERYLDFFVEDADFRPPISRVSGAGYVGREGFAKYVEDFNDAFRSFGGEIVEVTEIRPHVFTSRTRVTAQRAGGGTIDALLYGVAGFRAGRIALAIGSYDPKEAAEALESVLDQEAPA